MPLNIRSEELKPRAEKLASRAGVSKAEAARIALTNALDRQYRGSDALPARIGGFRTRASSPKSGPEADEAFDDGPNVA
ncbi:MULTISPECIES: type II toxin-antitoxin system VapB family antitoxin [Methylobacterium]|uniref:Type II toxin-antitoxin system VapB family antitoxin n=1 Tax=Methylobacterium longum TaxID=767694 RepID=A0ABT8AX20_9HYPH|nr:MULTISPECIES: type II toxin-antitoxin system VapB family antitoxin [Methylobacterium]MCJ2103675.1 type II toxin-antitoxin system VapB family antitoxin [Methylobacterium sp. E-046]MDN3574524.1 type II toxin-antitoxin system VapB family antitoxin [Methylobacterium longum]GJE09308.1 hypothetical protein FOHLNKBM_0330 [Methylobacterium longum]